MLPSAKSLSKSKGVADTTSDRNCGTKGSAITCPYRQTTQPGDHLKCDECAADLVPHGIAGKVGIAIRRFFRPRRKKEEALSAGRPMHRDGDGHWFVREVAFKQRFPTLDGIPAADWLECRKIEKQLG